MSKEPVLPQIKRPTGDVYLKIEALLVDAGRMKTRGDSVLAEERWSRAHQLVHDRLEPWAEGEAQTQVFFLLDLDLGRVRRSLAGRSTLKLGPTRAHLKELERLLQP